MCVVVHGTLDNGFEWALGVLSEGTVNRSKMVTLPVPRDRCPIVQFLFHHVISKRDERSNCIARSVFYLWFQFAQ